LRKFARRPDKDRMDLFRETARTMGVHAAIVEKDFWVCWMLDYLFHLSPFAELLVFKGGTSLSKAYGAISRFSEDVDLILDWRSLGYSAYEPWRVLSATKQDALSREANSKTGEFLADKFLPALAEDIGRFIGRSASVSIAGQEVIFMYPRAFALAAIIPQIKLEIGPLAAWQPNEERKICCFAAEHFPVFFEKSHTSVRTTSAERTFWEKVTILHQEAHRGPDKTLPARFSRHYYDLYRLSLLPIADSALTSLSLLEEVVQFKTRFYRCSWARYDLARPGSIRLLPPDHHLGELQRDYRAMQAMLFGIVPDFNEIISSLGNLENRINSLSTTSL